MHRGLMVATLLLLAPCATAQVQYYGTLGIYDDPAHTQPFGSMTPGFKTIYISVDLEPRGPSFEGLVGLELSVSGLDAVSVVGMDVQPPNALVLGNISAPADTVMGSGGVNIAWTFCIPDSVISIALTLESDAPPTDHVFQVRRRFPPSSSAYPFPLAVSSDCNGPTFLRMPLVGLSYTLNPTIANESRTWSAVKSLFRSP